MTESTGQPAQVTLKVPAQSAYVSVLRTTAASLAARLDFTIDDIEDLRISVGEASALLLPDVSGPVSLDAVFTLLPHELTLDLTADCRTCTDVDTDSFAWQVLSTLAHSCEVTHAESSTTITLIVRSTLLD